MAKRRTNRVAWGLIWVLAGLVLGGSGFLLRHGGQGSAIRVHWHPLYEHWHVGIVPVVEVRCFGPWTVTGRALCLGPGAICVSKRQRPDRHEPLAVP